MATATFDLSTQLSPAAAAPKVAPQTAPRKGLFMRFMEAMMAARMRQAMRELALHQHLMPPVDVVPQDELKRAGYTATQADAGLLPFVR